MIVYSTPTGWEMIYQRAHALLAGQIAAQWRVDQRPERWVETLAAIIQHDDGGLEWEGSGLLTPAGAPKDFKLGTVSLLQPTESVMHARYQGQYIALLQSMHVCTLYKDFSDDPEIVQFVADQEGLQREWRKALKMTKTEADADYRLLYWCDAFSLILCQRQLPTDGRRIEIGNGPDKAPYYARALPDAGGSDPRSGGGETLLTVEPWAFEANAFTVHIEATQVESLSFASDLELVEAMQNGTIKTLTWRFEKTSKA